MELQVCQGEKNSDTVGRSIQAAISLRATQRVAFRYATEGVFRVGR